MSDKFILGTGQAHELAMAFERNGWDNAQIKDLTKGDTLAQVRQVLMGYSEIRPIARPIARDIDCDANPFVPDGWRVEEHTKGGIFTWDSTKVKLYLSKKQKEGDKCIRGHDLRKELASQTVLNANALDYVLKPKNQHLIPDDWKGMRVFFWGTIYRYTNIDLGVRYLYWHGDRWHGHYFWLDGEFYFGDPSAVRVS